MESYVWVLDIDGPTGMTNLRRLQIAYGKLPTTYTVQTPSGGRHYYFTHNPRVKRTISFLASHIDTITNGYCLIPPSTINGKQYTVLTDAPIVPAPAWLIKLASNTSKQVDIAYQNKSVRYDNEENYEFKVWRARRYVEKMAPAIQGQGGHTQLLRVCAVLVRKFHLSDVDCRDVLLDYNARCVPPFTNYKELFRKINEARKWHE